MTPAFQVAIGGVAIGGSLNDRLLELTVVDGEGTQSDSATIAVDDRDAAVALPQKGDTLAIAMGYKETGLRPMGLFTVDEVETTGFPRQVTIQCRAADMGSALKQTRNTGYEKKTIGTIVNEMAGRHGLQAMVSPSLSNFMYEYVAQSTESDLHFGSRLADKHDAIFKIAGGKMLFTKRGEAAGGMLVIIGDLLGGGDVTDYSAKAKARPEHKQAVGAWWDRKKATEVREAASSAAGPAEHVVRHDHNTKDEAKAWSESQAGRLDRQQGSLNITIVGNPAAAAEQLLSVAGVRPGSADGLWRIKTATHTLNSSGYTTTIEAETPGGSSTGGGP